MQRAHEIVVSIKITISFSSLKYHMVDTDVLTSEALKGSSALFTLRADQFLILRRANNPTRVVHNPTFRHF